MPQSPGNGYSPFSGATTGQVGNVVGRPVVVGDDDLEPERARVLDLGDRGDAAVDGEHEIESFFGKPCQRAGVQPVPLFEARRQMPGHVCTELAQEQHGERRGADAVRVVVAVHTDARAALDCSTDRRDGGFHVAEPQRIVARQLPVEEATCLVDVDVPAAREHRPGRLGDAESRRESPHIGVGALLELPGSRRHRVADGTDGVGRRTRRKPLDVLEFSPRVEDARRSRL